MFARVAVIAAFVASAFAAPTALNVRATTHTGQGTFYTPGLGACGISNTEADMIVAVSHTFFDTYPGAGANPNTNPLCNQKITATYQGKSVDVTITDRCTGCAEFDLDFSPAAFNKLADPSVGRISGVTWTI